ncbi:hypothetical protein BJX76DRAFT_349272 [Aspergillus varians]
MSETDHELEEWATYPRGLGLSAVEVDAKDYTRRLKQAEKLLFMDEEDENQAHVLDLGSPRQGKLICFLFQDGSWDPLQISAEFLKRLFTFLRVHPAFLDIVFLFGAKAGPVEQSYSSCFSHCRPLVTEPPAAGLACSYDIGYNIKYAAAHGRSVPKDPFVVRETGVYHSFDAETQQTQWVFLQASEELQECVKEYFARPEECHAEAQIRMHGMIFQAASQGWREYLVYLEDTFSKMVAKGFYSSLTSAKSVGGFDLECADIRRLQFFNDTLERLLQVLQRNIEIAGQVKCVLERTERLSPPHLSSAFEDTTSSIQASALQHRVHSSRIQSLISRAGGSATLVRNILDLRATESTAKINSRMRELAETNARETESMSIIALISAIFLPAMFLATLFGTNFFDYQGGSIHIASNFWIYIVMALGMSVFTVLLWVFHQHSRKSRPRQRQHDLEAGEEKS